MSAGHVPNSNSIRFTLEPIGPVWCNAHLETSGQAHQTLIAYREPGAIHALLRVVIGLLAAGDERPLRTFAWDNPSCRYRWQFHPKARDRALLRIEKAPDVFGRDMGTRLFEASVSIRGFSRAAYLGARDLLRVIGIPAEAEGNTAPIPVAEFLRVHALVMGERVRRSRGGHIRDRDAYLRLLSA